MFKLLYVMIEVSV